MATSQSASDHEQTQEHTELIRELEDHLTDAHFNELTGNVIGRLKPRDDYYGAYRAAQSRGFDVSVYASNKFSLKLRFR